MKEWLKWSGLDLTQQLVISYRKINEVYISGSEFPLFEFKQDSEYPEDLGGFPQSIQLRVGTTPPFGH
jgi:hypothetical protein